MLLDLGQSQARMRRQCSRLVVCSRLLLAVELCTYIHSLPHGFPCHVKVPHNLGTIVAGALARATRRVRFLPLDVVAEDLGAALAVLRTVVAQLSPPSTELRRLALLELVEHTARVFTGTVL